ncbi:MAG: hypothetical protein IT240_10725 [Bacteroidia bacterium]|nr:hypothetical protein [Bacteroidia bacterium]MCC6769508.1 hypothetical protein [Bacteroidia bacterium]
MATRSLSGFTLLLLFCFLSGSALAQQQEQTPDSIRVHSPKKAALLSTVLPGAGQFYNKKYWKIGVIAAGTGALIYSFQFNTKYYRLYKNELIIRQQKSGIPNPDLDRYTDGNLNDLQSFYRRNRDLTVVGFGLLYVLNIIDATVDAHLFDFDLNDSLSMHLRPTLQAMPTDYTLAKGFSIQFNF